MRLQLTARRLLRNVAAASFACAVVGADGLAGAQSDVEAETSAEVSGYTDSDNVSVLTPALAAEVSDPGAGVTASGSMLVDIVTAASVDIVSTATPRWTELRYAGSLGGSYQPGTVGASLSGSFSREPDYTSLSAGGALLAELDDKHITPRLGYVYTRDEAGRSGTPFSVYSLVLQRHTLQASAALVVSRSTLLTLMGDVMLEHGRQEKPYRYLPLFDPSVADDLAPGASVDRVNALRLPGRTAERVPDDRQRYALSGRLARRGDDSTWIVHERLYGDSWGVLATTLDVRWVLDLGRRAFVWPHARAHLQTGAAFWERAYTATYAGATLNVPKLRSGDRELSPLWTATLGGGGRYNFGPSRRPDSWGAVLQADVIHTRFLDALFIDQRWGVLAVAQLEKRF